jgi:Ser/Thr protein kinase RdoA (MazF antagonist)
LSDATAASLRRLDRATMIEEPTARAVALLRDRPALAASVQRVADGVIKYLEGMRGDLGIGLCHGDCHGYNAIIDGDVATLLDFDDGGVGWQAYDIATFLRTREFSPATCRELCSSFIAGYRSLRALPAADREALEAMAMVRELWTYGAHAEGAEHWGDRWFHSVWIERRIEALAARFDRMAAPRLV